MMQRHEADGTIDHPEYKGAIDVLNYRHVCRLQVWPDAVKASLGDWNMAPYRAIQGPNEFCYTGSIKDWNRVPDLHRITQPALVLCGLHDELTPGLFGPDPPGAAEQQHPRLPQFLPPAVLGGAGAVFRRARGFSRPTQRLNGPGPRQADRDLCIVINV